MTIGEVRKLCEEHKVSSCDTGTLGYLLGHLMDHGLTRSEVASIVEFLLEGIEKMKNDPEMRKAAEAIGASAAAAAEGD